MDRNRSIFYISELIYKDLSGVITLEEKEILERWCSENSNNQQLFDRLIKKEGLSDKILEYQRYSVSEGWQSVNAKINKNSKSAWIRYLKYAAIIIIPIGFVFTLFYFINRYQAEQELDLLSEEHIDRKNTNARNVILTLSTGQEVEIPEYGCDSVVIDHGISIADTNQFLTYCLNSFGEMNASTDYNEIRVPKGRIFKLQLSEGTKIWMNNSSSLKYPVVFGGTERRVHLDGEAYFEVSEDQSRPFVVEVNGMEIEVLGTEFNIMAYPDEPVYKTTLLSGKVNVRNLSSNIIIEPGEQVSMNVNTQQVEVKTVDVNNSIEWKNGRFVFYNEDLGNIMKKLERWYDFEYEFDNRSVENYRFTGTLVQFDDLNTIFELLEEATPINFATTENGEKVIIQEDN